jgi:uncharacterized protein YbjT (DUF2867 family)
MPNEMLVIGGTGMLGRPVAEQCRADGLDVALMSSHPDRARERLAGRFKIVPGDVTDIESLRRAVAGYRFVWVNLSAALDPVNYRKIEIEGTANIARVCREMGVARLGMISGSSSKGEERGAIYLDAKIRAERAIMESGVPYTIMRPSWFFESLPAFVQRGRALVPGHQPHRYGWLAAADYARQVSVAFRADRAANKCFYNVGPEKMTMLEALTKYCRSQHIHLRPREIPFGMLRLMSFLPGMGNLKLLVPFFRYFAGNPEDVDSTEADRLLGPNTTTLDEWLKEQRPPAFV